MDGLLVVDKPSGPTSHDVVARMRRILRERRIGHTGTLDPLATGVLPLVIGRATRLARFLSAGDKSYEAIVRLGFATDTADSDGTQVGARYEHPLPAVEVIDRALDAFRGQFLQQPPLFSAKKIGGRRSYDLARQGPTRVGPGSDRGRTGVGLNQDVDGAPAPTLVTVNRLVITNLDADQVSLTLHCSGGFYVRSLAHDLGERLGTGAHLIALRRTLSGECSLDDSISLAAAERDPQAAARGVVPLARMLTSLPPVTLDAEGLQRALHGCNLEAPAAPTADPDSWPFVRLLDSAGDLVAIAERMGPSGLLHPSVVLR
ncbi:MAG: tRNA pseudouridine(55) synthase TruB [Acidobacteria bacterium]|nr:MAG: tRNA pseudouridine(55) synthase TruB [Acidobacteriota bacterium]